MSRNYLNYGEQALENQKKPDNPLVKYSSRKNLSAVERLKKVT